MRRDGGERLRRYRVRYLPTGQAVRLRLPAGRCAPKRLPTYLPTYRENKKPPCGGCVALPVALRSRFGCEPCERFIVLSLPYHPPIMLCLPCERFPVCDCEGFVCGSLKRREALKGGSSLEPE
jgi:hypothetical protein